MEFTLDVAARLLRLAFYSGALALGLACLYFLAVGALLFALVLASELRPAYGSTHPVGCPVIVSPAGRFICAPTWGD